MRFEVSFKFSFQNPFLSMKMKVKSFQIGLAGVHSTSLRFKSGEGNVGRKVGTMSDLTAPLLPAEMFLGQVPICLRHLEGLFLQVGWPIISSGTSLLSISANVKGMLPESRVCRLVDERQDWGCREESAGQGEVLLEQWQAYSCQEVCIS